MGFEEIDKDWSSNRSYRRRQTEVLTDGDGCAVGTFEVSTVSVDRKGVLKMSIYVQTVYSGQLECMQ